MKSLVSYINEAKVDIKAEVEEIVNKGKTHIEEWYSKTTFCDNNGCNGYIFKSKEAAIRSILKGENHQNAIDYVNGAQSDEEWISYLVRGGVDKDKATKIINGGKWSQVVKIVVDADGPEWFLSQYSGQVHNLSNGYLLYY